MTNPDAIVRNSPRDPGAYTELTYPHHNTCRAVVRRIREAEVVLRPWGGGLVMLDGRAIGLSLEVARQAMDLVAGDRRHPAPQRLRIIVDDTTSLHFPAG